MRKWLLAVSLIAVGLGGMFFGSPYLAARNLQQSALSGDKDALEQVVDFPSVRESLKSQMNAAIMTKLQNDPEMANNPFAGLAMMLAPAILERAVEAYVTPDGIAAIVAGQKPNGGPVEPNPNVDFESQWINVDRFRVIAREKNSDKAMPSFLFERQGFATWKLVKIEFPDGFLDAE